ncbi:MAG: hypothetical protein IPK32_03020 [Verrucomicrobiaceae bacterium]|nr:hypothetical protein [Verrucomicrobiaceae bacterium]
MTSNGSPALQVDKTRPMRMDDAMTIYRTLCLLMLFMPLACSWKTKSKPEEKKDNRTGQARLIGVVDMVNPEQGYVLINCEQRPNLRDGTELIALDHLGNKSKLLVTPEHKGNYITADIKEGSPTTGCLVLQKIRDSDKLPDTAPKPGETPASTSSSSVAPMPTERPPPIPEIIFPSQGGSTVPTAPPPVPSSGDALPMPIPLDPLPPAIEPPPAPDLSKLPPVIR